MTHGQRRSRPQARDVEMCVGGFHRHHERSSIAQSKSMALKGLRRTDGSLVPWRDLGDLLR